MQLSKKEINNDPLILELSLKACKKARKMQKQSLVLQIYLFSLSKFYVLVL